MSAAAEEGAALLKAALEKCEGPIIVAHSHWVKPPSEFVDVDDDDLGIGIHPRGDTVRFISYEDHGSILLADVELDRGDVERLRDSLTTWLEQQ